MSTEALIAILAFVGMFGTWAVLPTFLKKRHAGRIEKEGAPE